MESNEVTMPLKENSRIRRRRKRCTVTMKLDPRVYRDAEHLAENRMMSIEDWCAQVIANSVPRMCRICGCTDDDCSQCIEKTGDACHWIEEDLCSACVEEA